MGHTSGGARASAARLMERAMARPVAAVVLDDLTLREPTPDPGEVVARLEAGRVRANRLGYAELAEIALLLKVWEPGETERRLDRLRGRRDTSAESLTRACVVTEVAFALGLTDGAAARRVDAAQALIVDARLPVTARLAANGVLDGRRIDALVTRTRDLTPEQTTEVEARVLTMRTLAETVGRFEDAVDRAVLAVDAEAAERRRTGVRSGRRVAFWKNRNLADGVDGGAALMASGPAEALLAAWNAVDAAARYLRGNGDARTLDQLRHDLVVTGCTTSGLPVPQDVLDEAMTTASTTASTTAGSASTAPGTAGAGHDDPVTGPGDTTTDPADLGDATAFRAALAAVDARIDVVVPVDTLHGAGTPGHLVGYGPIGAQLARDLAETGIWRCLGVDATHGAVLSVGRTTYTPGYAAGRNLRAFLAAAAPRCTFGTCNARGEFCDTDHHVPHAHGGATCICNTGPVCRRHHRQKSAGYTRIEPSTDPTHPPGTKIVTTRAGRRHVVFPHAPVPPDPGHAHRADDDRDDLGRPRAATCHPMRRGDHRPVTARRSAVPPADDAPPF